MQISDPEAGARWTGLAVGFGIAALVGVGALLMMIMRRRDQALSGVIGGPPTPVPFYYPAPSLPGSVPPPPGLTYGNLPSQSTFTPTPLQPPPTSAASGS